MIRVLSVIRVIRVLRVIRLLRVATSVSVPVLGSHNDSICCLWRSKRGHYERVTMRGSL